MAELRRIGTGDRRELAAPGLLAVDSEGARVAFDLQVLGERSVYLILEHDTAIDLALRITGAVMRQRRAATA